MGGGLTGRMRRLAVGVGVVAVAGVGGGVALAAVGDGGLITSCVKGDTWRVISLVNPAQSCKSSETQQQMYTKSGADAAFLSQAEGDALYLNQKPRQYQVIGEFSEIAPNGSALVEASCAVGDVVTGGGYILNGLRGMTVITEVMSNNQRGWQVFIGNPTIATNNVAAQAMCLDYTP